MAEFSLNPKRRKIEIKENTCCFCLKSFLTHDKITVLDKNKLDSILSVCRVVADESAEFILANELLIKEGSLSIKYHKRCRVAYVRKGQTDVPISTCEKVPEQNCSTSESFTRSKSVNPSFDWKTSCFICGQRCHPKKRSKWSLVEGCTNTSSPLYQKLIEAATIKHDQDVLKRLLSVNGDLVAAEARYHRKKGCLSAYISSKNIKSESTPEKITYIDIARLLKSELSTSISVDKSVYQLSTLKERFLEIAEENKFPVKNVRTSKLKKVLKKAWPEIVYISQAGGHDLVCCAGVTVDDAIAVTRQLNNKVIETDGNTFEIQSQSVNENSLQLEDSDDIILYKAARILRNRHQKRIKMTDEYFAPEELTLKGQKTYIDTILYKFIGWVSSQQHFENASDMNDDCKLDARVLAVCCDITSLMTSAITPKHLGLSVHLHHTFGSKKLIDELNKLGYTMSYRDVRQFLTSSAVHMTQIQQQTSSGALIPSHVSNKDQSNKLYIAAADNWDHIENTIDGKHTTHAMTSILITPQSSKDHTSGRVKRVQDLKLDISSTPGGRLNAVLHYQKPNIRPQPKLYPEPSISELHPSEPETSKLLRLKNILYAIGRCDAFCEDLAQPLPPWTVFESISCQDKLKEPSDITFNPIIMATPTDYSTVYTTLKRAQEQINGLGQRSCPIFFDMGLLTKALEIVWARPTEFSGVLPFEGGMHFLMSIFGGIGFLYGSAGIEQLLVDSDVFAKKTVQYMLSGREFDKTLRAMLMIDEVLRKRQLIQFHSWCQRNAAHLPGQMSGLIAEFQSRSQYGESYSEVCKQIESVFLPVFASFVSHGREISPTFRFWDDFLERVLLPLKLYIAASRHGFWDAYEYSKTLLLPFLFSSNRSVYARYMPYLVLQMQRVPEEVKQGFSDGSFVAKLTSGKFNSVWIDYVLEATENKSLKCLGGIIGITHRDNALARWFLSRPVTAKYSLVYSQDLVGPKTLSDSHHTDNESYKKTYNENVEKMCQMFESTFFDPFCIRDPPKNLVNFATGQIMPSDIESSLLGSLQKGEDALHKFVSERFVVNSPESEPKKSFYDPIPKCSVKTMQLGTQTALRKANQSNKIPLNGEETYLRLLAINAYKKVPLERVMSYENAPVPLSLFTDEGNMHNNTKSDFLHKLEGLVESQVNFSTVRDNDCTIFDGMALIQRLQPSTQSGICTYNEMASWFWNHILHTCRNVPIIHVVFDRYVHNSLKAQTRMKRGETGTPIVPHIVPDMKILDWKKVLTSSECKGKLTHYYTIHAAEHLYRHLSENQTVYVGGGLKEKCIRIKHNSVEFVKQLYSNQEEADTQIILHADFAAQHGAKHIQVVCPDTDVLVLLVHFFGQLDIDELFFETGRKCLHTDQTRNIPVHSICSALTDDQKKIILAVYCLTGCDTCSSFYGIGKKSVFKLLIKTAAKLQNLASLGDHCDLTKEHMQSCTRFIGMLYNCYTDVALNKLRALYVLEKKVVKPRRLPPTDDSFQLHLLRCVYQLYVWKASLKPMLEIPDPLDYGYLLDNTGSLVPHMMSQAVAPPELLNDLVCQCKNLCEDECICSMNEQPCTSACGCDGCIQETNCCRNLFTVLATVTV